MSWRRRWRLRRRSPFAFHRAPGADELRRDSDCPNVLCGVSALLSSLSRPNDACSTRCSPHGSFALIRRQRRTPDADGNRFRGLTARTAGGGGRALSHPVRVVEVDLEVELIRFGSRITARTDAVPEGTLFTGLPGVDTPGAAGVATDCEFEFVDFSVTEDSRAGSSPVFSTVTATVPVESTRAPESTFTASKPRRRRFRFRVRPFARGRIDPAPSLSEACLCTCIRDDWNGIVSWACTVIDAHIEGNRPSKASR